MTKYDEVMEKIKVTPEMRARILQNAAAQCKPSDQKKPARVTVLRRFAALAACLRQSVGAEDHSGDWNEYPAQQTITAAGCTVTLKGETGSYTLAIWTDGNYSYSLSLSSGQPESVWQTIIEGVQ